MTQPDNQFKYDIETDISFLRGIMVGWNLGVLENNEALLAVNRRFEQLMKEKRKIQDDQNG